MAEVRLVTNRNNVKQTNKANKNTFRRLMHPERPGGVEGARRKADGVAARVRTGGGRRRKLVVGGTPLPAKRVRKLDLGVALRGAC